MIDAMGVCGSYAYIDVMLFVLNDYSYPDIANEFYINVFGCVGGGGGV